MLYKLIEYFYQLSTLLFLKRELSSIFCTNVKDLFFKYQFYIQYFAIIYNVEYLMLRVKQ